MTVYELIKELVWNDPDREVHVLVNGTNFDIDDVSSKQFSDEVIIHIS